MDSLYFVNVIFRYQRITSFSNVTDALLIPLPFWDVFN